MVVFSGSKIPEFVLEGGTIFSMRTRLRDGIKRFAIEKRWDEIASENQKKKRVSEELELKLEPYFGLLGLCLEGLRMII